MTTGRRIAVGLVLLGFLAACCPPRTVTMGSPYERYDHNRTSELVFPPVQEARTLKDEMYTPFGSESFPKVSATGQTKKPDRLPEANIVPIFTGVALPLSDEPGANGDSDRKDLVDYLAAGPLAKAGVDRKPTSGGDAEVYRPILDFLASTACISGGESQIAKQLPGVEIDFASRVIDARFELSSFAETVGLKYKDFWFVLYRLPKANCYSRLVVVPVRSKGQDFSGKKPGGG
jgi:hypothetical protein